MNVIARLEYELAYYDSAVHRLNHNTTRTLPTALTYALNNRYDRRMVPSFLICTQILSVVAGRSSKRGWIHLNRRLTKMLDFFFRFRLILFLQVWKMIKFNIYSKYLFMFRNYLGYLRSSKRTRCYLPYAAVGVKWQ